MYAAVEIAIGQPAQRRESAWIANLGECGRDAHPDHELAIVGERSQPIENLDAPVFLERGESRERPDCGYPRACRAAIAHVVVRDGDGALVAQLRHPS